MSFSERGIKEHLEGAMIVGYDLPANLGVTGVTILKLLEVLVNLAILLDVSFQLFLEPLAD